MTSGFAPGSKVADRDGKVFSVVSDDGTTGKLNAMDGTGLVVGLRRVDVVVVSEPISPDKVDEIDEIDVFSAAKATISERGADHNKENSFADIADRWNLWFAQRFSLGISLTPADVADMLQEFKQARRLSRLRVGKVKPDDAVDQAAYIWWRENLRKGEGNAGNREGS